jgi:hypothetical protein
VSGGHATGDTIVNFENVTGSSYNDTLLAVAVITVSTVVLAMTPLTAVLAMTLLTAMLAMTLLTAMLAMTPCEGLPAMIRLTWRGGRFP